MKEKNYHEHIRREAAHAKQEIIAAATEATETIAATGKNVADTAASVTGTVAGGAKAAVAAAGKITRRPNGPWRWQPILAVLILLAAAAVWFAVRHDVRSWMDAKRALGYTPQLDATQPEQWGYAMGYMLGGQMRQGMEAQADVYGDMDRGAMMAGLRDAVLRGKGSYTDAEVEEILDARMTIEEGKAKEKADAAAARSAAFVEAYAAGDGVLTTPGGTLYTVQATGTGRAIGATGSALITYEGRLTDGTVFDSSAMQGGAAVSFSPSDVIPGFGEALALMRVGDTWEIVIPAEEAYGTYGAGPIGPNEALVFTVTVESIEK